MIDISKVSSENINMKNVQIFKIFSIYSTDFDNILLFTF